MDSLHKTSHDLFLPLLQMYEQETTKKKYNSTLVALLERQHGKTLKRKTSLQLLPFLSAGLPYPKRLWLSPIFWFENGQEKDQKKLSIFSPLTPSEAKSCPPFLFCLLFLLNKGSPPLLPTCLPTICKLVFPFFACDNLSRWR